MVKIAIAGGSGRIARGIVDALVATKKHDVLILTRKDLNATENIPGVEWVQTDYKDKQQLITILSGVNTVLSFIIAHADVDSVAQKLLIDASIEAGVKRFAPSEWASSSIEELPWYAEKVNVRKYLEDINKSRKVIEYTLFQPGFITDMLTPSQQELYIDFPNRRAILIDGREALYTATIMSDVANIVVQAIEYKGEWPVIGGINGGNITDSKILEIGVKARGGKPWDVTYLKEEDVRADEIKSSWIPKIESPGMAPEQAEFFGKVILKGILLSGVCGSWVVSDEWNRLLPGYKFACSGKFLVEAWEGKP